MYVPTGKYASLVQISVVYDSVYTNVCTDTSTDTLAIHETVSDNMKLG